MSVLDQARATQLANIAAKTGVALPELRAVILAEGVKKHSELRAFAQERLGLTYGDANALIHFAQQSDGQSAAAGQLLSPDAVVDALYDGDKAGLRPIHDAVSAVLDRLGSYEVVPKKGYVSLRRAKQFAMLGPATKSQVELGLNLKDALESPRAKAQAPGGMCQYKIRLSSAAEVDKELSGWLARAFAAAE